MSVELVVDPERVKHDNTTGIYVRAIFRGAYGSYDIACLNLVSLFAWLHSRGQQNILAENALAIVLGHAAPFQEVKS